MTLLIIGVKIIAALFWGDYRGQNGLALRGRIHVTDYSLGDESLLFSSAEVLTYGIFDRPVVVFYLKEGQTGDFAFKSSSNVTLSTTSGQSDVTSSASNSTGYSRFTYTQGKGATVVQFSNGALAYLLDIPTAYTFFVPATTENPNVSPDNQIFVVGPYLVRSASASGGTVCIVGDNANATTIEVYAGSGVDKIAWNGKDLLTEKTSYGSLTSTLSGTSDRQIALPTLSNFRSADSSPKIYASYDDSNWIVADKTTTLSQVKPYTLPVLFSSGYKFYTGAKIYRGYFSGTSVSSLNMTVQGGRAAGWNAWLNGQPLGYHPGNASLLATTALLSFKNIALKDEGNVITVFTDYTSHDETSTSPTGPENPRGILGAQLFINHNKEVPFTQGKIQGGLYGERLGRHLPGFVTSAWEESSPVDDGVKGAGVNWFTTTFDLDVDADLDVAIGVELGAEAGIVARVLLPVNSYQYGKFFPHIGPQTRFPIPPAIINTTGKSTLSIALWSQTEAGAKLSTLRLFEYARYESRFRFAEINGKVLQPEWVDRSVYA